MSHSKACCTLPAVASDYKPVGTIENLGDLPVYTVGPKDATKSVLVIYDVFGVHVNTQQFCDILAKNCGWKVVMPDFFRGQNVPKECVDNRSALIEWIGKVGSYDIVYADVARVQANLEEQGVTAATLMSILLTASMPFFIGAANIHPSIVDNADAEKAKVPILNIPTKDEPDMTEYQAILEKKPFGHKCKMVRFDDIHHGFCAARGDFTNPHNIQRANEAIKLTVEFFTDLFNEKKSQL